MMDSSTAMLQSLFSRRASHEIGALSTQEDEHLKSISFPYKEWSEITQNYLKYWSWYDGSVLSSVKATTAKGEPILRFPLTINTVANFAQKHAAILLGEEQFDTPNPLVKTVVSPKLPLNGQNPADADKKTALLLQNVVNETWTANRGRSLQVENATLQQFLGGCVFQLSWTPWRKDMLVPITIKNIIPDFFFPIWSQDDYWDLLEAFVIYRLPSAVANRMYGLNLAHNSSVLYLEHWTRETYSIYVDGQPLKSKFSGVEIEYKNQANPFGFVPFVYIPHIRIGSFWGNSHVPSIAGLVMEYNARMGDLGDATRKAVHRNRYVRNLAQNPQKIQLAEGVNAINLGVESPVAKNPPDVITEEPPDMGDYYLNFAEKLWKQTMREGNIGDIAFGEDEGSQRSALTLAFRMYPSTSHARLERAFWGDGMNVIARYILKMLYIAQNDKDMKKALDSNLEAIPEDFERRYQYAADWLPMIPRDREAVVSELVLRKQAGLVSTRKALQDFGDVRNVDDELTEIQADKEFEASLGEKPGEGEGAPTQLSAPVAKDSLRE